MTKGSLQSQPDESTTAVLCLMRSDNIVQKVNMKAMKQSFQVAFKVSRTILRNNSYILGMS